MKSVITTSQYAQFVPVSKQSGQQFKNQNTLIQSCQKSALPATNFRFQNQNAIKGIQKTSNVKCAFEKHSNSQSFQPQKSSFHNSIFDNSINQSRVGIQDFQLQSNFADQGIQTSSFLGFSNQSTYQAPAPANADHKSMILADSFQRNFDFNQNQQKPNFLNTTILNQNQNTIIESRSDTKKAALINEPLMYEIKHFYELIQLIATQDVSISDEIYSDPLLTGKFLIDLEKNTSQLFSSMRENGLCVSMKNDREIQWDLAKYKQEVESLLQTIGIQRYQNHDEANEFYQCVTLNTVALTEKGMGEKQMKKLAKIFSQATKFNSKQHLKTRETYIIEDYIEQLDSEIDILTRAVTKLANKFQDKRWVDENTQNQSSLLQLTENLDDLQYYVQTDKLTKFDRKFTALYGLLIADALAMPSHFITDKNQLIKDYGVIKNFKQPLKKMKGSNLNQTYQNQKSEENKQNIIGKTILKGKEHLWKDKTDIHYHHGLKAGENTLEANLTKLAIRQMIQDGEFDQTKFRQTYINYMTNSGSNKDTYASMSHINFFKNIVDGKPLEDCPDSDANNVDLLEALTITVPVIIRYAEASQDERNAKVIQALKSFRNVNSAEKYALIFSDLLVSVIQGKDLRFSLEMASYQVGIDHIDQMVKEYQYEPKINEPIEDSFKSLIYFAYRYYEDPEIALIINANSCGENVSRGALLGALMGAAYGYSSLPQWSKEGLIDRDEITKELTTFIQ